MGPIDEVSLFRMAIIASIVPLVAIVVAAAVLAILRSNRRQREIFIARENREAREGDARPWRRPLPRDDEGHFQASPPD